MTFSGKDGPIDELELTHLVGYRERLHATGNGNASNPNLHAAAITEYQAGAVAYTHITCPDACSQPLHMAFDGNRQVCLIYMLKGDCELNMDGIPNTYYHRGNHSSVYLPLPFSLHIKFTSIGHSAVVIIRMVDRFFLKHIAFQHRFFESLKRKVECDSPMALVESPAYFTHEQATVLTEILYCKRQVHIKEAYMETKISELLILHLEQIEQRSKQVTLHALREEELNRVYKVRDMLRREPHKSYSLVGLAHSVGTNDATLKKHFKMVYGTTVFNYLTTCRMELAKSLLLKENCKVSNVAQEVGYKHASHFSTAFRKYFGYLPTQLIPSLAPLCMSVVFVV